MRKTINHFSFKIIFFVFACCIAGTSCVTQNLMQTPKIANQMPEGSFITSAKKQYIIKQTDKLNISIWNHDDLSVGSIYGIYNSNEVYGKWVMVDNKGAITLPKIGEFKIEGLTIVQAEDSLKRFLSKWIVNPILTIKVLNKEVVVMGDVKAPGKIQLEKDNYLLTDVIAMAGDFDLYANKKKIIVVRTIDGVQKQLSINLTRSDNFAINNINVLPGDLIYIPSKRAKDFDKRIATVTPFTSIVTTFVIIYSAFIKK